MNPIDALEAQLAEDPRGQLREQLAANDDNLLESLVKLRRAKGLTQDMVAQAMNRSKTAVSNFERLGADPHLSTIRRYAAAVGAMIHTIVEDYDARPQGEVVVVTIQRRHAATGREDSLMSNWHKV